jgi:hypothetical protein
LNAGFIDLSTLAALVFDCGHLTEALRFGDLKLEGYKTAVARFKDLTAWSFIMASAHGAGLMLVPVLLKLSGKMQEMEHQAHEAHEHWGHSVHLFLTNSAALADLAAVGVHTAAMFAVMAAVALVV